MKYKYVLRNSLYLDEELQNILVINKKFYLDNNLS